jgi:hypothetical protein
LGERIWPTGKFNQPSGSTNDKPWGVVQHFDVWSFASSGTDNSYFGKMLPGVAENLLWLYTEPFEVWGERR